MKHIRVCQRRAGEPCMSDNNGTVFATTPRKFALRNLLRNIYTVYICLEIYILYVYIYIYIYIYILVLSID